jgi:crotonobetainyl-CoA:carnitine CoA-transferase CaiB-like acyl-CoA transferase
MEVHGRNARQPRRLGVELASVASGVLATQGILAALLAQLRGGECHRVSTSTLQAGLFTATHYLARATADDDWTPPCPGVESPPPFVTADGHRFELESLSPQTWKRFWRGVGVEGPEVDDAWEPFLMRYIAATCALPATLHEAIGRTDWARVHAAADDAGCTVQRLRRSWEVVTDLRSGPLSRQRSPDGGLIGPPWLIEPLAEATATNGRHTAVAAPGLPLRGIRVVEATRRLQGPVAALVLSLLGAEVIRIEPPGGDPFRLMPPFAGDVSASFRAFNRGKDVREVDLHDPQGQQQVAELVADADVFVHNWGPGKAEARGLDAARLGARNPWLVYAQASGWSGLLGADPPLGTDYVIQAYTGLGDPLTPAHQPPAPSLFTLTDMMGALTVSEGILAALVLRERTHQGYRVEGSLLSGGLALQAHTLEALAEHERSSDDAAAAATRPSWGPLDQPVPTDDGYLLVGGEGGAPREPLERACDVSPHGRTRAGLAESVADRLRHRSTHHWTQALSAAGIAHVEVCADPSALPQDPAIAAYLDRLDGCWTAAPPWTFLGQ